MHDVYLVRHGAVENPGQVLYGSLSGFPLSDLGRQQVRRTAEFFASLSVRPREIVSSPLERAMETASTIAARIGVPVMTDGRLTEWGMGSWEGGPVEAFYRRSGYYGMPRRMDGLESLEDAAARVLAAVADARRRSPDAPVVAVSHRESLVAAILALESDGFDRIHEVRTPVGSAWKLTFDGGMLASSGLVFEP